MFSVTGAVARQHFSERIDDPPRPFRKFREMLEENGHPRPWHLFRENCIHVRAPSRISAPRESHSYRQDKIPSFRGVNLSAVPPDRWGVVVDIFLFARAAIVKRICLGPDAILDYGQPLAVGDLIRCLEAYEAIYRAEGSKP